MAEEMKMIYKAIAGVMEDIGAVGKEKEFRSNQGSYKFRGIDDVMNALHPAMVRNKIFVVPVILEQIREVRTSKMGTSMYVSICKIRYEFYAEDGSCVSAVVIGEGMDTGDKATNKAMSIAFKYACFQVFCIPTEEMIDPDAERPELEEDKPKGNSKGKASKQKAENKQQTAPQDAPKTAAEAKPTDIISQQMLDTIRSEQKRTGVSDELVLGRKYVKAKKIEELTIEEFKYIMSIFEKTPNKQEAANE